MPAGTSYLVKEGMIGKTVCRETYNADAYYKFTVKNNFLHAIHPVGWFRKIDIELDGKAWDTKDSYFVLRGQFFRIPDMHTISEVYWNLCEPAEIYLKQERTRSRSLLQPACWRIRRFLTGRENTATGWNLPRAPLNWFKEREKHEKLY